MAQLKMYRIQPRATMYYPYIFPRFPDVCYAIMPPSGAANGPIDLEFGMTIDFGHTFALYYISVSNSTPLTVTGPYGQLASLKLHSNIAKYQLQFMYLNFPFYSNKNAT